MMRRAIILLACVGTLAGCDSGRSGNRQEIRMANPYHDDLMKLSPGYQRIALSTTVRNGGYRNYCRRVDNAGYQEEYRNMRMWVAECSAEQRRYAVFIAPNGDVQVRNCDDTGELSLPACKGLPPPVADDTIPKVENGASDEAYRQRPATPEKP